MEIIGEKYYDWDSKKIHDGIFFASCDFDSISKVREYISTRISKFDLSEREIYEVISICDELVCNGIKATLRNHSTESVILRWQFNSDSRSFNILVLDTGGGFDQKETLNILQRKGDMRSGYIEHLLTHSQKREPITDRSGRAIRDAGMGLRIIFNIADNIRIYFYDLLGLAHQEYDEETTIGTIVNVRYYVS